MKAPGLLGGSAVLANIVVNVVNAPTWAVVLVIVISLICVLVLGVLQIAVPQESQDKRLLWERFFDYEERRHIAAPAKKSRQRRPAPAVRERDVTVVALPCSPTSSERSTARSP